METSPFARFSVGFAPDPDFDKMADLTRRVVGVPYAAVSLVDEDCHLLPGTSGLSGAYEETRTAPLSRSFCRHVVRRQEPLVVADAREVTLLADNPAVLDASVIAYAGMPLVDSGGTAVGSLCVFDDKPHSWTDEQVALLRDLAAACSKQLHLREVSARHAVDADRLRIADSLNRTVVRDLFTLSMTLGGARSKIFGPGDREVGQAMEDLDEILKSVRNAVYEPVA